MKHFLPLLGASILLSGCGKPSADNHQEHHHVELRTGRGLTLSETLRANLGLTLVEVAEQQVAPELTIDLQTTSGSLASGWTTPAQAALLKIGLQAELRIGRHPSQPAEGVVTAIAPAPYPLTDRFEVAVQAKEPLPAGSHLSATFQGPAGKPAMAVPRSALLQTAEGWFVYTLNGAFLLRTPVTLGANNSQLAEITDGLYEGDQVVASPVQTLWMSELQLLRGGKGCADGH